MSKSINITEILKRFEKQFIYRKENPIDIMSKPDDDGDRIEVNGEFGKIKAFLKTSLNKLLDSIPVEEKHDGMGCCCCKEGDTPLGLTCDYYAENQQIRKLKQTIKQLRL